MILRLKDGRKFCVSDKYDFEELLLMELGDDSLDYFQKILDEETAEIREAVYDDPFRFCGGECDKIYSMQEHYETALADIQESLQEIYADHASLKRPHNLGAIRELLAEIEKRKIQ